MYNLCLRMLNNRMDAEDILQRSFVDIFTKLDQFNFESTPGAWIKRIMVNNCINALRKKKIFFEELKDSNTSISDTNSEYTVNTYKVDIVKEAIHSLPDGYRVVLSLYLMEGYDHTEISEILNISTSTSKSQYSRAKRKLKETLAEKGMSRDDFLE